MSLNYQTLKCMIESSKDLPHQHVSGIRCNYIFSPIVVLKTFFAFAINTARTYRPHLHQSNSRGMFHVNLSSNFETRQSCRLDEVATCPTFERLHRGRKDARIGALNYYNNIEPDLCCSINKSFDSKNYSLKIAFPTVFHNQSMENFHYEIKIRFVIN
jgi:hypothetical protein